MTPNTLKIKVRKAGHSPYFFTADTMRFFGDTMANYGVRVAFINTRQGQAVECWELYRKHPVKNGLMDSAYFHAVTFNRIHPKGD